MTPWLDDGDIRLYHGDALEVLRELPDGSVDCVVTSPPYWGLRDYGIGGQLGLEATPDEYVAGMVAVFREVRRVLADHGTCWVNLGDSYNSRLDGSHGGWNGSSPDPQVVDDRGPTNRWSGQMRGLAQKNLMGMPWRVAFGLQEDGWILRSDIIWAKPNPMPESVTDRPTKSHEYVFLLTKRPRYWFDAEAVREPYLEPARAASRMEEGFRAEKYGSRYVEQGQAPSNADHRGGKGPDGRRNTRVVGQDGSEQHRNGERWPNPTGRNVRSVWQIATQPYPEAHFATFPEELARRCILAGCPTRVCRVCGKPSERIVERGELVGKDRGGNYNGRELDKGVNRNHGTPGLAYELTTVGWSDCGHNAYRPGLVLDPFMGSGTVAKVARDHQRHAIGIDLNESYLGLAARRLQQLSLLTGDVA